MWIFKKSSQVSPTWKIFQFSMLYCDLQTISQVKMLFEVYSKKKLKGRRYSDNWDIHSGTMTPILHWLCFFFFFVAGGIIYANVSKLWNEARQSFTPPFYRCVDFRETSFYEVKSWKCLLKVHLSKVAKTKKENIHERL